MSRLQIANYSLDFLSVQEATLKCPDQRLPPLIQIFANLLNLDDDSGKEGQVQVLFAGEVIDDYIASLAVTIEAAIPLLEAAKGSRESKWKTLWAVAWRLRPSLAVSVAKSIRTGSRGR